MTHIKTFYGDGGKLKVTLQKDKNDNNYNVITKIKNKNKWEIVEYYKFKNKSEANKVYKRISEEF